MYAVGNAKYRFMFLVDLNKRRHIFVFMFITNITNVL